MLESHVNNHEYMTAQLFDQTASFCNMLCLISMTCYTVSMSTRIILFRILSVENEKVIFKLFLIPFLKRVNALLN